MPKDKKEIAVKTGPQQLPMPKYDYQKSQGGSVSAPYRSDQARDQAPAHVLHNVHFG